MTKFQFGSAAMLTINKCVAMPELYELTIARQADNRSQTQYYLTTAEIAALAQNLSNLIETHPTN